MYNFIQLLAPHLSLKLIQRSESVQSLEELQHILQGILVPWRDRAGLLGTPLRRGSASQRAKAPADGA